MKMPVRHHGYTHFHQALIALGRTNKERADHLVVDTNVISYYLNGHCMPSVRTLMRAPVLLAALLQDAMTEERP